MVEIMHKTSQVFCAVIIVTHNSQAYIDKCLESLQKQTRHPDRIIIIDSGSDDPTYLSRYQHTENVDLHLIKTNIGFCQGNNIGMAQLPFEVDYVLFLNPDAFLTPEFLGKAIQCMEAPSSSNVGVLTGLLLGYSYYENQATGTIDSAGIFQTWYGKWYDRSQGEVYTQQYYQRESIPAICGALMFCRKKALDSVVLDGPHEVMDPSFYMYKEDIDLSLRLRQRGWMLIFEPQFIAYHCRGWNKDRTEVPRHLRLMSARNEMRLHARLYSPYVIYSALKYAAVKILNI